jgi:hypothetical protein
LQQKVYDLTTTNERLNKKHEEIITSNKALSSELKVAQTLVEGLKEKEKQSPQLSQRYLLRCDLVVTYSR